ncbi:ABC transporter involved in cytochrome c biogenesis, ATPase component CcmA [Methanosarcina sp. MTP4]|uniref:ABC transporter ATP-binding protein n=1 Tax=Methanosarcina sp. MTP4 TaxID=1434100 RepID=UPI0006161D32|nr:ABC transporter ATP-binding protein [Methanosarcina sp. MTP4]AKB24502.1 ABC transporter involved in cytochrome c biogenesis, ATPase component CcmA [Methanosarcina sp. MTP4]
MENAVSIRNLSKTFGKNPVLKNLDLDLKKGEFTVIFGPNGAGKTTLLKLIATLIEPGEGSLIINGFDSAEEPEKVRKEIGMLSHESYLYGDLTAEENLFFFGKMYGLGKQELEIRSEYLLNEVGLETRADERVSTFSRGMKQRLSIARALINEPSLLILDEPYTGLDPRASEVFEHILKSPSFEASSKIMVSHDLERGFALCDRILVLKAGRIVYDGLKGDFSGFSEFKEACAPLLA